MRQRSGEVGGRRVRLVVMLLAPLASCTGLTVDPLGRPCSTTQPCGPGAICNLATSICVEVPVDGAVHRDGPMDLATDGNPPVSDYRPLTDRAHDAKSPFDTGRSETMPPDIKPPPDIKLPPDIKPPPPCTEANSGLFGGHCYFLVAASSGWTSAKNSCAALSVAGHPVHLVTVTSAAEHTFVTTLPGGTGYGRWIGLQSAAPSNNKSDFSWITGEAATLDKWMAGRPHSAGACVVLHSPSYSPPNVWEDDSCSTKYLHICERE